MAQFNGGDVTDVFTTGLMSEQESTGITHHINNGCIPLGGRGSGGGADWTLISKTAVRSPAAPECQPRNITGALWIESNVSLLIGILHLDISVWMCVNEWSRPVLQQTSIQSWNTGSRNILGWPIRSEDSFIHVSDWDTKWKTGPPLTQLTLLSAGLKTLKCYLLCHYGK